MRLTEESFTANGYTGVIYCDCPGCNAEVHAEADTIEAALTAVDDMAETNSFVLVGGRWYCADHAER